MRAAPLDHTSRYFPQLRRYRRAAGLTQAELAKRAGYRDATLISRVERGGYVGTVAETLIARALDLTEQERARAFGYPTSGYPGSEPIDFGREREERRRSPQPRTPSRDAQAPDSTGLCHPV